VFKADIIISYVQLVSTACMSNLITNIIESVDSICRDSMDTQYMIINSTKFHYSFTMVFAQNSSILH